MLNIQHQTSWGHPAARGRELLSAAELAHLIASRTKQAIERGSKADIVVNDVDGRTVCVA